MVDTESAVLASGTLNLGSYGSKTHYGHAEFWVAVKELKLSYYILGNPIIYHIYPLW